MAMLPCRECKKPISTDADACANCGAPTIGGLRRAGKNAEADAIMAKHARKGIPVTGWVAIGVVALVVVVAIQGSGSDSIAAKPAALTGGSASPTSPAVASGPQWGLSEGKGEMDGSPRVVLAIDADGKVEGWLSSKVPTLVVRCSEKRTEVYVNTGLRASVERGGDLESHTVRLRFDDGEPVTQAWSEGTDGKALFAAGSVDLAKRIAKAKALRFQFTPHNASPAVATFPVAGADTLVPKVATACGWRL